MCDLVNLIQTKYLYPVLQALSNDLNDFNMQLSVTKCLNTSVMLMVMMIGIVKGTRAANRCSSESVAKLNRHNDNLVLDKLQSSLSHKRIKNRHLYFVLMNECSSVSSSGKEVYFPGHAFVIEKIPGEQNNIFNIYQSYILKYDLREYKERLQFRLTEMDLFKTEVVINMIRYVINSDTWDDTCVNFWKALTSVDTSFMKDVTFKEKIHICYMHEPVTSCFRTACRYAQIVRAKAANAVSNGLHNDTYGDSKKYKYSTSKPLNNKEMMVMMENMLADMKCSSITLLSP